jgi:hypothetical protein
MRSFVPLRHDGSVAILTHCADAVQAGVCIDLFLFPNGYVDVATIGTLCSITGGEIHRYPFFKSGSDTGKVRST